MTTYIYAFIFENVRKYKWNDDTFKISLYFFYEIAIDFLTCAATPYTCDLQMESNRDTEKYWKATSVVL